MADGWPRSPGADVLNEVVLNQVLVRFDDDDALTRDVAARVQDDGTAWLAGTTYHGRVAIRISVSNWATTEDDGDRTVAAIRALPGETARGRPRRGCAGDPRRPRIGAVVLAAGAGSRFGGGKLLAAARRAADPAARPRRGPGGRP